MKASPILASPKKEDKPLSPHRKLIVLAFYQWESGEVVGTVVSKRARKQFETELNTIFLPKWNNPFQFGIFGKRGKNFKKLLQVENRKELQSLVFWYLLKTITRSHDGNSSGEVQFLIDHYFMEIGRNRVLDGKKLVYDKTLEMLEKIVSKYRGLFPAVEFWWKKPKYGDAPSVYGKKLSLADRVKWFEYYGNKWKNNRIKTAWLSFIWAVAGAVFFNQRFIDIMGRPRYNNFNTRDSIYHLVY